MYKFSIIVPAYNEEECLPLLVENIKKHREKFKWNCELIIVNDNSSDKTPEIAEDFSRKNSWIRVIHRKKGYNGMGAALKEGTAAADSGIVVWVMADDSDDLSKINDFVEKIGSGKDVVFGSRYMAGGSRGNLAFTKALMGVVYTTCTRLLFGIKIHDITNAFRAFRKKDFLKLNIESNDFAISPEHAIKSRLRNLKMAEVPVTYKDRARGQSDFSILKMGLRYGGLFKYRFSRF